MRDGGRAEPAEGDAEEEEREEGVAAVEVLVSDVVKTSGVEVAVVLAGSIDDGSDDDMASKRIRNDGTEKLRDTFDVAGC